MITIKQTSDGVRWVAISSTAYEDRDNEIVSTKALSQAVAQNKSKKEFGPLRFWHTPGIELGTTDFQAVTQNGKFLVESGLISDEYAPQIVRAFKSGKWQVSIGFVHPPTEPDKNGVFHNISIFERSIVPNGNAANGQTSIELSGR
jgi:hypothetical protein